MKTANDSRVLAVAHTRFLSRLPRAMSVTKTRLPPTLSFNLNPAVGRLWLSTATGSLSACVKMLASWRLSSVAILRADAMSDLLTAKMSAISVMPPTGEGTTRLIYRFGSPSNLIEIGVDSIIFAG